MIQNQVIENYYCKIKMELSFPVCVGGSKQPVLRLHAPNFPHSGFSVAGSDVWRFFQDFITKEQNSSTANSEGGRGVGGCPFTGVVQPNKTHMSSTSNSSLNVVMN